MGTGPRASRGLGWRAIVVARLDPSLARGARLITRIGDWERAPARAGGWVGVRSWLHDLTPRSREGLV